MADLAVASVRTRLSTQLDSLTTILAGLAEADLMREATDGKWSIHHHVAHLARHHQVMLQRIDRVRTEASPSLDRYKAELDPEWPAMAARSSEGVIELLQSLRRDLVRVVDSLSASEWARVGIHPVLGPMNLVEWMDFFLLHEAHHLYTVRLLAGSRRADGSSPTLSLPT